ncbi:hypothetical protein [Flavobacterium sp.]|uniref:hypothetical protein n=1 Tax=Flavobacterium sp. TaxID=239 RepID=UPI003C40349D
MKEIHPIYQNEFGVSFFWKLEKDIIKDKIQLVFKETGLQMNLEELIAFKCLIEESYGQNYCCDECELKVNCSKYLVKTPFNEVDLALSINEMILMNNLVSTTLFKIDLENYLWGIGRN